MLVCSIFSGWHRNFFVLPVVCMWKLQKYYHYIPYESKDVSEVRTKRSGKLLLYIFSLERTRHRVEGKKWSPRTLKALSWNISLILPPTTSYDPRVIKAIYHYIYGFPTALHSPFTVITFIHPLLLHIHSTFIHYWFILPPFSLFPMHPYGYLLGSLLGFCLEVYASQPWWATAAPLWCPTTAVPPQ